VERKVSFFRLRLRAHQSNGGLCAVETQLHIEAVAGLRLFGRTEVFYDVAELARRFRVIGSLPSILVFFKFISLKSRISSQKEYA
jgi:hypothetical protein